MIVCICHRVSDRDIARAVREGCDSFDELQDALRVGTGCGACDGCARDTFEAHRGASAPRVMVTLWGTACLLVPMPVEALA
jgi:bacterioferritin-associated ferredoxin